MLQYSSWKIWLQKKWLLCILPPFLCTYNDIVIKYFGENPPNATREFLCTLLELQENLKFIKRRRRVEEQSLTTSESIQNAENNVTKETNILEKKLRKSINK